MLNAEPNGRTLQKRGAVQLLLDDVTRIVQVPVFGDASAGPGRIPLEDRVVRYEAMTVSEFMFLFKRPPPNGDQIRGLGLFTVIGRSAAPVYFEGEVVPVEVLPQGTQEFVNDNVYVFRWEEQIMLKSLRRIQGGRIEALSLNPGISEFVFRPSSEHEFAVLGRVIENEKQQLYGAMIGRFLMLDRQREL